MKFRIVRRLWFAVVSVTSLLTFCLCFFVARYLPLTWPIQVLAILPFVTCSLCAWIAVRGNFGKRCVSFQTVGTELVGVMILIPSHLAFIVLEIGTEPETGLDWRAHAAFVALHASYGVTAVFLTLYALTLVALALAAWYTVDPQIWSRDPVASPGPFPLRLIFAAMMTRAEEAGMLPVAHDVCMPGCVCKQKLPPWSPTAQPNTRSLDLVAASQATGPTLASHVSLTIPTPSQRTRIYSVQLGGQM